MVDGRSPQHPAWWSPLRRGLRSRWLILAELLTVALAGVLATHLPQHGAASTQEVERFSDDHPLFATATRALGLHDIYHSAWFLGLVLLASTSLAVVLVDQWQSLFRGLRHPLSETSFAHALYRRTFVAAEDKSLPHPLLSRRGRLGAFGSPVFHLGLMLVILAGLARVLWGAEASVEVLEGARLGTTLDALDSHSTGLLASPVALPIPLVIERLSPSYYPSGDLRGLVADAAVLAPNGSTSVQIGVNSNYYLGSYRVFLSNAFGPAILLEVHEGPSIERRVLPLRSSLAVAHRWDGTLTLPSGLQVRVSADARTATPGRFDMRVLRGGALLRVGELAPGHVLSAGQALAVELRDVRKWVRLDVSRDRAAFVAYLGFGLMVFGATVMFLVVRIDSAILVSGRQVTVAMAPQRFAPLYEERFEALVRKAGG